MQGLYKRGSIWWIEKTVRAAGRSKKLRESTGTSEEPLARKILDIRINETKLELYRDTGSIEAPERTWGEAAAEYIVDIERRGKSADRAKYAVKKLFPTIGSLPISHVHQRTLQPWIDTQKGVIASGTVKYTLAVCTSVMIYASRVLRDGNRPWLSTPIPKLSAPDWGSRKPYPLTWVEQDRLLDELPDSLLAPVRFALATGAREHEICMLRWADVCHVEGLPKYSVFWIPPEVRKGSSRLATSDQKGRYLVANADARRAVEEQKGKHDVWVFPTPSPLRKDGGRRKINSRAWLKAVHRAGLAIRFHDLRHTFGERLASVGCPHDVRATLLGHVNSSITMHYSAPGLSRLLEEAERVKRGSAPTLRAVSIGNKR